MSDQSATADLATRVMQVIATTQRIPLESISLNSTFEQLKIDSLDGINIVFALENEFGINIPDDGVQSMRSIGETVEGVQKLLELNHEGKRFQSPTTFSGFCGIDGSDEIPGDRAGRSIRPFK